MKLTPPILPFATYCERLTASPVVTLEHGDRIRCIKRCAYDAIKVGEIYRTFGAYPKHPSDANQDCVSVCVADPEDCFGGVLPVPVECFEKVRERANV